MNKTVYRGTDDDSRLGSNSKVVTKQKKKKKETGRASTIEWYFFIMSIKLIISGATALSLGKAVTAAQGADTHSVAIARPFGDGPSISAVAPFHRISKIARGGNVT